MFLNSILLKNHYKLVILSIILQIIFNLFLKIIFKDNEIKNNKSIKIVENNDNTYNYLFNIITIFSKKFINISFMSVFYLTDIYLSNNIKENFKVLEVYNNIPGKSGVNFDLMPNIYAFCNIKESLKNLIFFRRVYNIIEYILIIILR